MINNEKVTCISPWYELRINSDGSMSFCHAVKKTFWEKSNLNFIDWFNKGESSTAARQNILKGKPVDACQNCYDNEAKGFTSYRQRRNIQGAVYHGENFKDSLEQSPAYPRMQGKVEEMYPAFLHVTLSNLCNLSCRMCFPEFSSQLTDTYKKLNIIDKSVPILEDWSQSDEKWQNFLKLVKGNKQLLSLHFMGGEPLYHKRFHEFIDWAIENNETNYHLTFVTNVTIYDSELIDKLAKFKSVQIEMSIEVMDIVNDYIRIGSDFNVLKDNIQKFLSHKNSNTKMVLRTVPQALSIPKYDTIIDFAIENDCMIDCNVISNPPHLKMNVLPKEFKNDLVNKLKTKYADILGIEDMDKITKISQIREPQKALFRSHINYLIAALEEAEPENIEELRQKFIQYNIDMDTQSTLKFKSVYPELVDFYEKYSNI